VEKAVKGEKGEKEARKELQDAEKGSAAGPGKGTRTGAGAAAHKCGVDEQTPEGARCRTNDSKTQDTLAQDTLPRTHTHTLELTNQYRQSSSGAKQTAKGKRQGGEARATAIKITKRPGEMGGGVF